MNRKAIKEQGKKGKGKRKGRGKGRGKKAVPFHSRYIGRDVLLDFDLKSSKVEAWLYRKVVLAEIIEWQSKGLFSWVGIIY